MIVTFHFVVYYGCKVFRKCFPVIFPNESRLNLIKCNDNKCNRPTSNCHCHNNDTEVLVINEPNVSSTNNSSIKDGHPCIVYNNDNDVKQFIYDIQPIFECKIDSKGIKFTPPVYAQRYMIIEEILKNQNWVNIIKKVVDFGCAELSFEAKHLKKCYEILEIVSVDIDEDVLTRNSCKLCPNPTDYLQPRPTPLTARIFCGSVAHTHNALVNSDAVIAIELIEHLYPQDLEDLPFTVFGFIKPKLVIFTTPNADFNSLFPNFSKFRHDDHKFEWSREQFEDWGNNLVVRYSNYTVTFRGVGPGPAGTKALGCCSQMAIFVKGNEDSSIIEEELDIQDGVYTLIQEYTYPYFVDKRTDKEKLRDDIICFITRYKLISRQYDENEETELLLPVKVIMDRVKCFNKEKVKDILFESCWKIKTEENGCEVVIIPESESEEEESSLDISEDEQNGAVVADSSADWEDWDCDMRSSSKTETDNGWQHSVNNSDMYHNTAAITDSTCLFYSCDQINSNESEQFQNKD